MIVIAEEAIRKISDRVAVIRVIALGYLGLPLVCTGHLTSAVQMDLA